METQTPNKSAIASSKGYEPAPMPPNQETQSPTESRHDGERASQHGHGRGRGSSRSRGGRGDQVGRKRKKDAGRAEWRYAQNVFNLSPNWTN